MEELSREPDLPDEPLDIDPGGELGVEQLEGDRPVVAAVARGQQAGVALATGLDLGSNS